MPALGQAAALGRPSGFPASATWFWRWPRRCQKKKRLAIWRD